MSQQTEDRVMVVREFEGHRVGFFEWKGRRAALAKEVGEALEYDNGGRRLVQNVTGEWTDREEMIEGVDYDMVRGSDLRDLKRIVELGSESAPSGAPHLVVLYETGINLAALLSRKPKARALRRWLAEEVLPQIKDTGAFIPAGSTPAIGMDEARLRFIIREEMQRQEEPPTPLPTLTHVQHTHGSLVLYEALHIKKSFTSEELARRLPCREQTVHDISLTHCNPTRLLRGRFQDVLGIATDAWDKPVGAKMERVDRPAQALPEGATPRLPEEKKRPNKDDLHRVAEALKKYPDAPPRVIIAAARIKRGIGYAALRMLANEAARKDGLH